LGLAVCKKVIEQHGGEIRVQSGPDHGTTFSLFLPVLGVNA
jgi:chemotaxis family two-component system sensor kinase Cph1